MSHRYHANLVIKLFPSVPKGVFGDGRLTRLLERRLFYREFQVSPRKLALLAAAVGAVALWSVGSLALSLHAVLRAESLREQASVQREEAALAERRVAAARRDYYLLLSRLQPMERKVDQLADFSRKIAVVAGIDDLAADLGRTVQAESREVELAEERVAALEGRFERLGSFISDQELELSRTPSISPLDAGFVPTDRFGYRVNRLLRQAGDEARGGTGLQFHAGLDLAAPSGTPIRATADARVHFSGRIPVKQSQAAAPYGNFVVLDHENGIRTVYAHCERLGVEAGDVVRRGQVIGWVGSTGRSTGPHVHYEVVVHGRPLDPELFILDRPIPSQRVPAVLEDHPSLVDEVDKLLGFGA